MTWRNGVSGNRALEQAKICGRKGRARREGFTSLQDQDGDLKRSELGSRRLCCVPSAETAELLHTECTGPFRDLSNGSLPLEQTMRQHDSRSSSGRSRS